jgi:uncharacterized protein
MAWGGSRPGAGRKKVSGPWGRRVPAQEKKPVLRAVPKVKPAKTPILPAEVKADLPAIDPRVWMQMLPEIEAISQRYAVNKARSAENNPFRFPTFPEKAMPPKDSGLRMAMDSALGTNLQYASADWLSGSQLGGLAAEGLLFLGYTYLAELAQRPEYRVMAETIADDTTREWITFDVIGDEKQQAEERKKDPAGYDERIADPDEQKKRVKASGKTDRVKQLQDDQLRLEVKDRFYEQCRNDGFFGRSHLFLDIRTTASGEDMDPAELKTTLGDSRDETSRSKVPQGSFKGLRTIEPVWTYPLAYNAINPLRADWYNPQVWFVMGQEIHGSRIPTFIGHPVPDMLKPAYAFGGLSLSQMAKPYVDRWLTTVTSVNQLIHSFSVMVLMTDMSTLMAPGNVSALLARVAMFNMLRDNQGTFVVNKNTEDFKNVSASLAGLHELQAQAQEHMASINRIPLVKFTGIQPAGLNASSEGEIEVYDDTIAAYQSRFCDPNLRRVINFEMLSLWGEVDPEITHRWNPLRQITDAERGEKQKKDAERDQIYIDQGAISPEEVRKRIINDPDLPYTGLDPDDMPVRPDPMGGAGEGGEGDDGEGGGGAPGGFSKPAGGAPAPKGGGANDAADPFGATDAEFVEGDHPRAPDGKFGSGGGSASSGTPKKASGAKSAPLKPGDLKKTGGKMGSNEGGTFEDKSGQKFYVKRPASKAHVANELAASRLYKLAGVNTLNYVDVEGGNHVATKLEKLDKKNISELTPAERKEAAKDFVVHAWLSNWDAAGTGGDNQGVLNGKVTTLDVGGSLRYRAQGGPKGAAFGPKVSEIETMRDPKMSPDAARLYGKMTDDELKTAATRVTSISDEDIRKAVGGDKELADTLIARKADLAKRFGSADKPAEHDLDDPSLVAVPMSKKAPEFAKSVVQWSIDKGYKPDVQTLKPNKLRATQKELNAPDEETDAKGAPFSQYTDKPVVVRENGTGLMHVVDGHNRISAAVRAGKPIDAYVFEEADVDSDALASMRKKHPAAADMAHDEAHFEEGKHPRAPDGKFATGGGGGSSSAPSSPAPTFKSKKEHAAHLLSTEGGITTKEMLAALGWPSISMPQTAKTLGMKLEKFKDGGVTKYKGTKMTPEEIAAAKAQAPAAKPSEPTQQQKEAAVMEKAKAAGLLTSQQPKYPPPTSKQIEAAKKTVALKLSYVPGDKPETESFQKYAQPWVDGFNKKWEGKAPSDMDAIKEKIADFVTLQGVISQIAAKEKVVKAETDAIAAAEAQKAAAAAAEAAKIEAAKSAEKNARIMKELGITEQQAAGVSELAKMMGSKSGDIVSSFKKYAQEAEGYGYPITGFQCALIHNYSGAGFVDINKALRSGAWTPAQHAYVSMVNKALMAMPKHTGVVTRNTMLTPEQIATYKEGHIKQEDALMSTSTKSVFSGNVQFKVTAIGKRAASIKKLSNHKSEDEVLFAAKTFFKVTKVEGGSGQTVIHMEEWDDHL